MPISIWNRSNVFISNRAASFIQSVNLLLRYPHTCGCMYGLQNAKGFMVVPGNQRSRMATSVVYANPSQPGATYYPQATPNFTHVYVSYVVCVFQL